MDFSFLIVLWIIFLVIQNVADKKKSKKLPPPESNGNLDFEIPTLANDPNQIPSAEVRKINLAELYQQKKSESVKKSDDVEQKKSPLEINPDSAMNAIIMSEILSKPKALRKK